MQPLSKTFKSATLYNFILNKLARPVTDRELTIITLLLIGDYVNKFKCNLLTGSLNHPLYKKYTCGAPKFNIYLEVNVDPNTKICTPKTSITTLDKIKNIEVKDWLEDRIAFYSDTTTDELMSLFTWPMDMPFYAENIYLFFYRDL